MISKYFLNLKARIVVWEWGSLEGCHLNIQNIPKFESDHKHICLLYTNKMYEGRCWGIQVAHHLVTQLLPEETQNHSVGRGLGMYKNRRGND